MRHYGKVDKDQVPYSDSSFTEKVFKKTIGTKKKSKEVKYALLTHYYYHYISIYFTYSLLVVNYNLLLLMRCYPCIVQNNRFGQSVF